MAQRAVDDLKNIIENKWSEPPDKKTRRYLGEFFDRTRIGNKIIAKVEGNHGTYTVSIEAKGKIISSACNCYIGKQGGCHHCRALALTFIKDAESFKAIRQKRLTSVRTMEDIAVYLRRTTLDSLLDEMKSKGITHKAFAESIGMNTRHLSSINSCEKRNMFYNELGATKLACLWVIEHVAKKPK